MKIAFAAVGLAGVLMAGSANAGVLAGNAIYSSFVTNSPDTATPSNYALTTGALRVAGSPLAQEFSVGATTQLSSLWLRLSDASPTDGGSILVYLVPNNPVTSLPTNNASLQLTGTTLLGTIFDSALPTPSSDGCQFGGLSPNINSCNTSLSINDTVSAGNYWIALVNGSDANNGGTNNSSSGAVWWRSAGSVDGSNPGINTTGNFSANVAVNGALTNGQHAAFELQVNAAPEPTTLALLGAGLAALGFVNRRRSKKSAE
jgi:hypothetical protein